MNFPGRFPEWDERRRFINPITREWVSGDITSGTEFLLEAGIYVVMVKVGADDHFFIVVGEEHFPFELLRRTTFPGVKRWVEWGSRAV